MTTTRTPLPLTTAACSRREALLTLGGVAAGAIALASGCGGAVHPTIQPRPGELAGDRLTIPLSELPQLASGRPVLVRPGKPFADVLVVRTADGHRAVTAACTHMGCTVGWSGDQAQWLCPCHGSRFAKDGTLIVGPARRPLRAVPVRVEGERLVLELAKS